MTNTYTEEEKLDVKVYEELRCIRCVLERLLNHLNSSAFVDYQFEKFGKDYKTRDDKIEEKS
jgi:hypothetical protein